MEVISKEVALDEFERLAEVWDIDLEQASDDKEDRSSLDAIRNRVVKHIINGSAVISEEGEVTFTLKHTKTDPNEITFKVATGDAYVGMDRYKSRQDVHKLNSFMGSMTGQPPAFFAKMDARDIKFCQSMVSLFLA